MDDVNDIVMFLSVVCNYNKQRINARRRFLDAMSSELQRSYNLHHSSIKQNLLLTSLLDEDAEERPRGRRSRLTLPMTPRRIPRVYCVECAPEVQLILDGDEKTTFTNLRVRPATVRRLVELLGLQKKSGWSPIFEVALFLFWLSSGSSYGVVSASFWIGRATVFNIITRILTLCVKAAPKVVRIPTQDELDKSGEKFAELGGSPVFRQCAGALDTCHIIVCRKDNTINKKFKYSVHFQALVNADGYFIDVFAGHSDNNILRRSSFWSDGTYPPSGYYIISNECPKGRRPGSLLTPFKEPLTAHQGAFNYAVSKTKFVVDRTLGRMKARWHMLFGAGHEMNVEKGASVIAACTMLHNVCLMEGDIIEPSDVVVRQPSAKSLREGTEGNDFRNEIFKQFCEEQNLV